MKYILTKQAIEEVHLVILHGFRACTYIIYQVTNYCSVSSKHAGKCALQIRQSIFSVGSIARIWPLIVFGNSFSQLIKLCVEEIFINGL